MKNTSTNDLAEIIAKSIQDEPYFSKEIIVPKIKALIVGFRLSLSSTNYSKKLSESKTAKLIRSNEIKNLEAFFWKEQLKKIVGEEKIKEYYSMLDVQRKIWDNESSKS